ncbi:hypothetical protein AYO38_02525 [bacterium SCGC AG-212-C10]|nr:hypothetical protein AYO38_02525 [bacterium SCGC AG-212-C10]
MTNTGYHTSSRGDLTSRQREVLDLIAQGRTNAEIATRLGISLDGAKWHVREILGRLEVDSREEAAAIWRADRSPIGRIRRWPAWFTGSIGGRLTIAAAVTVVVLVGGLAMVLALAGGDSTQLGSSDDGDATVAPGATRTTNASSTAPPSTASPSASATATPTFPATPAPSPTAIPTQQAGGDVLGAAPSVGPCPVQSALCDLALVAMPLIAQQDVAGLFTLTRPRQLTCPLQDEDKEGISSVDDVCAGVIDGDEVDVYLNSQGGEGLMALQATFAAALSEQVATASSANQAASDSYATGELRIGGFACVQGGSRDSATCDGTSAQILYTYMPANPASPRNPRSMICLRVRWDETGVPGFDGIGCGVPPTAALEPLDIADQNSDGSPARFVTYPWYPGP